MIREKTTGFLGRVMLSLFILLCLLALGLGACVGTNHRLAMLLAGAAAVVIWKLWPAMMKRVARLGPFRVWLLLTAVCLLLKGAWILLVRVPLAGDYKTYWGYAEMLAEREVIWGSRYVALFPHIFGYSWFLSWFIKLFGSGTLLAQGLNVLLSVCAGSLLFLLCRRLLTLEAAASVYLFWSLCPSQTIYNALVLSEPLYTALLLAFLLWMLVWEREQIKVFEAF